MKIKSLRNKGEGFVEVNPENAERAEQEQATMESLLERLAALEDELEAMKNV